MRDNTLVNIAVSRPKPSLENELLPEPAPELEVAETVEELLPIESTDPEEDRQTLLNTLETNENEPSVDPFTVRLAQEALKARISDAMENEYDDTDNIMITPTARPQVSWDELQVELPAVLNQSPDAELELKELAEVVDVSERVQVSLSMAKSMESATDRDLAFINIDLESFSKELKVEVPRLRIEGNQVSKASMEALERWNNRLREFAVDTYNQIRP